MANVPPDRELQRDFREWIESQKLKGFGAPGLVANSSYVPTPRIVEYFNTPQKLSQLLQRLDPHQNLVVHQRAIVNNYQKVLCILVIIGQGHHIASFVRHGRLCDARLPFEHEHRPDQFPWADNGDDFFEKFKEVQWQFCAEPFVYLMDRIYEDARVLPIMTKDPIGGGGSSHIFKITIPQAYDELEPDCDSEKKNPGFRHAHTYVLKTYRTRDAKSYYANEARAFRTVMAAAGRKHGPVRGLIGFHGNFIHGGTHNILLEYADKGTLEQYFMEVPPPTNEDDIISFWENLFFPIFALLNIHGLGEQDLEDPEVFQGWHQDIKPQNILVVSNDRQSPYKWEFKLADLGLTHFTKSKSTNGEATAMDAWGTRTYGAPESYRVDGLIGSARIRVKKSVDIWSLGCVFSEAATWLVLGKEGLLQYRADRRAETDQITKFRDSGCFHDGEKMLASVERTHKDIVGRKRRNDHITRRVIENMVQEMLGLEDGRPSAMQLWAKSKPSIEQAKGKRSSSMWSSSADSPLSSRAPTLKDASQSPQVGELSFSQKQSMQVTIPEHSSRAETRDFTGGKKRIEQSPEGIHEETSERHQDGMSTPAPSPHPEREQPDQPSSSGEQSDIAQSLKIRWSVSDASLWKDAQRRRGLRPKSLPEGGAWYNQMISKRDHVFIVDDSNSMRSGDWSEVASRFSLLAYIVKTADDDGLDLYFSSSTDKFHSKKSTELTDAVQRRKQQPVGGENLGSVLTKVWQTFYESMFGAGKGFLGMRSPKRKRPMTCYILTDGAWCSEKGKEIESLIVAFVSELVEKGTEKRDFGLQFISFGRDEEGLRFLKHLDDDLKVHGRDIVDTESANGDVWKMLLGSINKDIDKNKVIDRRFSTLLSQVVYPPIAATNTYGKIIDG